MTNDLTCGCGEIHTAGHLMVCRLAGFRCNMTDSMDVDLNVIELAKFDIGPMNSDL